jgi:hypothetical protein
MNTPYSKFELFTLAKEHLSRSVRKQAEQAEQAQ